MLSQEELKDLHPILAVQQDLVTKLSNQVSKVDASFSSNKETAQEIVSVQRLLDEVLKDIDLLSERDIEAAEQEVLGIEELYEQKRSQIQARLEKLQFTTWDEYVAQCYKYSFQQNVDPFTPYEAFLSEEDLKIIRSERYNQQFKWDRWDYMFVGLAGIVAALTDLFIVAIPKDLNTGVYQGQKGSPLTKWLQELRLPDNIQKWLEQTAKVPYDRTGGSHHRFDTFGHDPVLGFVFGVIDIFRGTSTSIKDGAIIIEKVGESANLLEALIKQFIHLCSDVLTKTGLPVPFSSIFKLLDVGSFQRANGKTATISQLAKWMYYNGYDLRHFATMSITPASIEVILRMYIMIRHYVEKGDVEWKLGSNPKYRSMLLSSHAIACATNVGKVYIHQGNPLAINYAEWLMLLRYLVPSLKYWLFDKGELEIAHLEKTNDAIWNELLDNSDKLLKKSKFDSMEPVYLGRESNGVVE